jgi:hypothetical protein
MIGYSLPIGDLAVGGMIGDAAGDRDVSFEIINPDPAQYAIGSPSSALTGIRSYVFRTAMTATSSSLVVTSMSKPKNW